MFHSSALPSLSCLLRPTLFTVYTQTLECAFWRAAGLEPWAQRSGSASDRCHLPPGVLSRSEKGTSVSQPWHQLRVCGSEAALLGFPKCNPRMFRSPIALRLSAVEAQLTQAGFARAEISPCCKPCSEGEGEALGKKRAAQVTLHTGLGWDGTIPASPISDLLQS